MTAVGLVSRASPVHTVVRNCTRDEGGPFGFGDQVADPRPPRAAAVKSRGGERCGNVGTMIPAGMIERGERKRIVERGARPSASGSPRYRAQIRGAGVWSEPSRCANR